MKNAFKTAFVICSSLIGAGFASGREIVEFFPPGRGLVSAVFSVILICASVFLILKSDGHICDNILYKWTVCLFSICVLSVMIAGTEQLLDCGRILMSVAVLATVFFGIRGVENVSLVLCPAMVLFIFLFGAAKIWGIRLYELSYSLSVSPLLYAGYNVLSFPALLRHSDNEKPLVTSVIVGMVMIPLIVVVYLASSLYPECEMPFAVAVGGGLFSVIMLVSAMYTTAVCSAFCVCDITNGGKPAAAFTVILAFLCSFSGFGQLISNGYRTFGFAGILSVIYLLMGQYTNSRTKIKR